VEESNSKRGRHEYHFVWVRKYRYKVLVGKVRERLEDILTELCEWLGITILEGVIKGEARPHVFVGKPKHSPTYVIKNTWQERELPELAKKYWEMHICVRGYCISTVGINEEVIREYVRKQQEENVKEEQRKLRKDISE
jgi:putative transposase